MKNPLIILFALSISTTYAATLDLSFTDNSDNEKGFVVERSIDGVTFEQLLTLEANITAFTDSDVPIGKTVYWRVYAWNDYGDSGFSNVVAELTSPPLGPSDLKIKKKNPFAQFFKNRAKPNRNR
jgi:hypothetical protein